MRKTKEILRQKWDQGLSHRKVAESLSISTGEITKVIKRAEEVGLDWAAVKDLGEIELDQRLNSAAVEAVRTKPLPDFNRIHQEYQRKAVTLALLHQEYREANPDGYEYTQFCEHYRRWLKQRGISMRQVHRAGEKLFTDFAGKKPSIIDSATGEAVEVELFVAALGASSFTFARVCRTQRVMDWIECHVLTFEYMGGVTELVVPDQLKSGVVVPDRYEPVLQRNYEEMATHYGTVVLPARQRKPKDKATVEVAVQVAERWIVARVRNERHFSLESMNLRVAELLEDLNHRTMRQYGASRWERFENLDKKALKPLPSERYEHAEWKMAKVNIDYHVDFDHHFYSVLFSWRDETVEIRATTRTVEIYLRGNRIASHIRSYGRGQYTTNPEHMPKAHQEHLEWSPSRLINWAATVGPRTAELVEGILATRPHPEQGYRACLGIMRLAKHYGAIRMEAAASHALYSRAFSYRYLNSMLQKGLDKLPLPSSGEQRRLPLDHENVRGGAYYV